LSRFNQYSGHCRATEIEADQRTCRKRDLEKEMETAGFRYSWRKMEAAAQDRAGSLWNVPPAAKRLKSS